VFDASPFPFVSKKYILPRELEARLPAIREGKTLVTLNGSFDLMHAGHLYILNEAAKQGDILLLMLNSDVSIQKYKGPDRPIISLNERLTLVAALEMVDYVTYFDEEDPRAILEHIRPDIHANGAEYGADCLEADLVRSHGGKIHLVKRQGTLASSAIIKKIKELCDY